jgi:hypothetical protein
LERDIFLIFELVIKEYTSAARAVMIATNTPLESIGDLLIAKSQIVLYVSL